MAESYRFTKTDWTIQVVLKEWYFRYEAVTLAFAIMSPSMQILFVSPRQCWPAVSGAKLRDYHLAKALGTRARLHYVFFQAPQGKTVTKSELPFCETITAIPPARTYTPAKILRGLLGKQPISVVNYTTPEMTAALTQIVGANKFDFVQFDSIHLAAYEPLVRRLQPKSRIVYDWHNIESDIMRQYAERSTSAARKFYSSVTARKLAGAEHDSLHSAFGHLVCSDRERAILVADVPRARVEVIENGVDTGRFPETADSGTRDRVLFVGQMDNHANIDAVTWFTREIWPGLHRKFPQWKLTLVGADPVPAVRALGSEAGVEVTGTVPDVAPYYKDAIAAIVPLRAGSGTRLKILEAMAARVPVVSTPIGAEGLDISDGGNLLLAPGDGPGCSEKWITALASLDPEQPLRATLTAAGRSLVEARYDWGVVGQRLYGAYERWLAKSA